MTVGDHDISYAPAPPVFLEGDELREQFAALMQRQARAEAAANARRKDRDVAHQFCMGLVAALDVAGRVTVVGNPVRVLMPTDPNPFPRIRLIGRTR